MPPLDSLEGCSSTALRKAASPNNNLLTDPTVHRHGYVDDASIALLTCAIADSGESLAKIEAHGVAAEQWVPTSPASS